MNNLDTKMAISDNWETNLLTTTMDSSIDINFNITDDWGDGFVAEIIITNTGNTPINGWVLEFDAPFEIANLWSGQIVSHSGNHYEVSNLDWNSTINPNQSISLGIVVHNANGLSREPINWYFNDQPIDDSPIFPSITINNVSLDEGDSGTKFATFKVKLSESTDQVVTVQYKTLDGTAIKGLDYQSKSGLLEFAPGETEKLIKVSIIGDTQTETNETFKINLFGSTNSTIEKVTGTGKIINDDLAAIAPNISISDVTLQEGDIGTTNALFKVKLSAATANEVTVQFNTQNGTAIKAEDYKRKSGTLTFAPGQTTKTIKIAVIGDNLDEADETFKVKLLNPTNAIIVDGQGVATIENDDSPQQGMFNYGEALQKSFLFYEAQRSGDLPADNRIEWRGDSALNDGSDVGKDLTGGYYDAGDFVKFGFPMAASMTLLSWGVLEYNIGYQESQQLDEALDAIKWGTDYILKAHITENNQTKEFWGQVGDGDIDHSYWGAPETMTMPRPAFKIDPQHPGSDLAGEAAAALASASLAFRDVDPIYADELVTNAKQLFQFADTYRGKYSDSISDADGFYHSYSGYNDELAWSAVWLYQATGDNQYLTKAESYYQGLNNHGTQSWDNKSYGAAILLADITDKQQYKTDVENWLNYWTDTSGAGIQYTDGGLAWLMEWGSLRYTANTAFLAGIYSDNVNDYDHRYSNFSQEQIEYMLGDNPLDFSYMIGFGDNYALQPHHRGAHGGSWADYNSPENNDHILYGALVGGPASPNDYDYEDLRTDYARNEVALDFNAGFTGALARMYDMFGGNPLSNAELDALDGIVVNSTLL